jgi:hypothetical protein
MFKDSIEIFQCQIEIIEGLIIRNINFVEVNLGFNWKELKKEVEL